MGTTGRSGGVKNPTGSKKSSMMPKPTTMRRSMGMGRGGMEKHNVSKGMPTIKHARLKKPRGRITSWGMNKRMSTQLWTAKVKKTK